MLPCGTPATTPSPHHPACHDYLQSEDMSAETSAEAVEIITAAIDKFLATENYEVRRGQRQRARQRQLSMPASMNPA